MTTWRNILPFAQVLSETRDLRLHRYFWLLKLRMMTLLAFVPILILSHAYGLITLKAQLLLTLFTLGYYFVNLTNTHQFQKHQGSPPSMNWPLIQDLSLFTLLLLFLGGAQHPLYSFYFLLALIGGFLTVGGQHFFLAVLIIQILLVQIFPTFSNLSLLKSLLNSQTLPYLFFQLLTPTLAYLTARSVGKMLDNYHQLLISEMKKHQSLNQLKTMGALTAGFAHEIASPLLSSKLRLTRFLRHHPPHQDLAECQLALQECEESLSRMRHTIESDIDDLFEEVDIKDHLKTLLMIWEKDYPKITIKEDLKPVKLKLAKIGLTHTLINLLDNAAEAMNEEGEIAITDESKDGHYQLSICDQGRGFNQDIIDRLGTPFVSLKPQGSGLGLYSSTHYVQAMGGELALQSTPNGAKATLSFPHFL
jgi:two-component system, sensor histidine kinase RegB